LTDSGTERLSPGLDYLAALTGYERTGRIAHPTLGPMIALMRELGDPQEQFPAIHLTGTNGKGSTAAVASALLRSAGLRVGTYTSPHLLDVTERVLVDRSPVEELDEGLQRVAAAAERLGLTPTWFQALTAAGLWCFAATAVDIAVVEVGKLGRWDATNVVNGTVAVVTNVELDHTDLAGPTRAAVAAEKAGTVKPGATLVLGEQNPCLRGIFDAERPRRVLTAGRELQILCRRSTPTGSVVDLVTPRGARAGIRVGALGSHQCDNALLALAAAEESVDSGLPHSAVQDALARINIPGRFEIVGHNPTVIVDVAHNPAGASALRHVLDEQASSEPRVLVCGVLAERNPNEFLDALGAASADLVVGVRPESARALVR